MNTIAILGANGQVGTEVCLLLSRMEGVRVVPVCRTAPAAAFLARCGLSCRVGTLGTADGARAVLQGCDTVVEFSLPVGSASEVRRATRTLVTHAIEAAPAGARYVFMSSMMAFGMAQTSAARSVRWVSRTIYGRTKRYAEALARREGRRARREVYLLRLGEVHGALQSVSRIARGRLRNEKALVPRGPSYVVFTHTVAEALAHIARGLEEPGRYTLVAQPELSWRELHEHHCRRAGVEPDVEEYGGATEGAPRPSLGGSLGVLRRYRETIAAYVLWRSPELERRLRGVHVRSAVAAEIAALGRARQWHPFQPTILGRLPGRRLRSLSDGRAGVEDMYRLTREMLDRARPAAP